MEVKVRPEWTGAHVRGSKCPPSKWKSRTADWDPAGPHLHLTVPRQSTMADHNHSKFVAVRDANVQRCRESCPEPQVPGRKDTNGSVRQNQCNDQTKTLASFWLSSVRAGRRAIRGCRNISQMERTLEDGNYLGRSPQHARLVALVLNLTTGHISPQFHIKFDPSFTRPAKRSALHRHCGK